MIRSKMFNKVGVALIGAAMALLSTAAAADIMVMGGNPTGSLFYAQSQAIASTIGRHSDLRVDVLPQSGTVFFPMFMTGEADIGLASPIGALLAADAEGPYEGANGGNGYRMRTVMLGSPIRLSLVVRKNAGIDKISDLKGKRVVANYGAFAGSTITALAVLANGGLSRDDVSVVNVSSYPEGVRAVMEGRADAAVGSVGSGILQQLNAQNGAKILPIDPSDAAMARAKAVGPAFVPLLVEKGSSVGVAQDTYTLTYAETIYARPDLGDDKVTTVIDALWQHHDELPKVHRSLSTWTPDRFASTQAALPYHPAAIAYYKKQGVWTDEMAEHQKKLLAEEAKRAER